LEIQQAYFSEAEAVGELDPPRIFDLRALTHLKIGFGVGVGRIAWRKLPLQICVYIKV